MIWITEVWDSREAHVCALEPPAVKAAIAKGARLIAGFAGHAVTTPLAP